MADLIVAHGFVITMDEDRRMIEDGAVAVEKDRIVDVGPSRRDPVAPSGGRDHRCEPQGRDPRPDRCSRACRTRIDKDLGAGDSGAWYRACDLAYTVASTPEFWHAEAQLAALERLKFGVTAGVSLLGGGDTILRTDDPAYGDAHCEGVAAVGTRSLVAVGPTRPPHPRTYARWAGDEQTRYPVDFATQLSDLRDADRPLAWHPRPAAQHCAHHADPARGAAGASCRLPDFAAAKEQAVRTQDIARARGLIFTQDGHDKGSVAFAHELGILGPNALLSHATDLTDEEIRICADTGTMIAHNPSAIASVLGRCPAPELMRGRRDCRARVGRDRA